MNKLYLQNRVAVIGAGESGQAAANLLLNEGAFVTVLETGSQANFERCLELFQDAPVRVVFGTAAEQVAATECFDSAILSPGVDPSISLVQTFIARGVRVIGEVELGYEKCSCPVIGVTGTNGKTTTTQLIAKLLSDCKLETIAAGNISPALTAVVAKTATMDAITVELSSFQLEAIKEFNASIAVWLGFAPDHLDRYKSLEAYYQAKIRIFENQTSDNWAIANYCSKLPESRHRVSTFSAFARGGDFDLRDWIVYFRGNAVLSLHHTKLRGAHNAENLMAALGLGLAVGLDFDAMRSSLSLYEPLPHRCEHIRYLHCVEWINDSKGTNLDSVEKALLGQDRPVILIAGGKDKGFDFSTITNVVARRCHCVVAIGEMADHIEEKWGKKVKVYNAGFSLERAVEIAQNCAKPGDAVVFSPGTSSFDMFKNYAERGDAFRALVEKLG